MSEDQFERLLIMLSEINGQLARCRIVLERWDKEKNYRGNGVK